MSKKTEELKLNNRTRWSYVGFVFQTFFKRPFGYIIALLYVLYLSIILLIVPAAIHLEPLFIWSNAAINMPIFNLFFIAAASGALAVAVFRTGRDDGTELSISAKPLTKNSRIFAKTFVYAIIMLGFAAVVTAILSLIYPVFGEYDMWTNPTGIAQDKYVGLLLSMFVGNIVNMLFFGGIAILISMVGGQVITIIGTVAVAFVMVLLNVIFPIAISSPLDVLRDKYSTSINSMVANTRSQYGKQSEDSPVTNYAAIQCITEMDGTEINHLDTSEYWAKANSESGLKTTNYVDFGKQLSYIFNAFGVDEAKLKAASKLMIGANVSSYYTIIDSTHITNKENLEAEKYPFCIYSASSKQGISYPLVHVMAGDLDLATTNWYAITTLFQSNWDAVVMASLYPNRYNSTSSLRDAVGQSWYKMCDLVLTDEEAAQSKIMFNALLQCDNYEEYSEDPTEYDQSAINIIKANNNDVFWKGNFDDLDLKQQFFIASKIQVNWLKLAQDWQIDMIDSYCEIMDIKDSFPYSSKTITSWYSDCVISQTGIKHLLYVPQKQIENIYTSAIFVNRTNDGKYDPIYPKTPLKTLECCETYNNIYAYTVTSFYNVNTLIIIWTIISLGLFTSSVIVYKRTDFK